MELFSGCSTPATTLTVFDQLESPMRHPYYLADITGKLRFTEQGLRELRPYFAMAGIDINKIDSVEDYYRARQQASPYFMEWMAERARQWPDTEQYQLLRGVILGESTP